MFFTARDHYTPRPGGGDSLHVLSHAPYSGRDHGIYVATLGEGHRGEAYLSKADAERLRDELAKAFPATPEHGLAVGDVVRINEGGDGPADAAVVDRPLVHSLGTVTAVSETSVTVVDHGSNTEGFRFRGEHALDVSAVSKVEGSAHFDAGYLPFEPVSKFTVGDRIVITRSPFLGKERQNGATGAVVAIRENGLVQITIGDDPSPWSIHSNSIELAPALTIGGRVRLTGPHTVVGRGRRIFTEAPDGEGSIARVIERGPTAFPRAEREGNTRVRWAGNGRTSLVATASLTLAPLDEPGDPKGSVVYITGGQGGSVDGCPPHSWPNGTEVTVDQYDATDGSYFVESAGGTGRWVYATDLDIEPPARTGVILRDGDFETDLDGDGPGPEVPYWLNKADAVGQTVTFTGRTRTWRGCALDEVRFEDGKTRWTKPGNFEEAPLKVGDRVAGYGDGEGYLVEIFPNFGTHGGTTGDCRVAWLKGRGLAGAACGASLSRLTKVTGTA